MKGFLRTAAVVAVIFLALDVPWLLLMGGTYRGWIGPLMTSDPALGLAALFYVVYAAAAAWLVVRPANSAQAAAINGAVLGFVAYGTYGFTNAATLRDWPVEMLIIDTIWGTALTSVTCLLAYLVVRRLDRRTTNRGSA